MNLIKHILIKNIKLYEKEKVVFSGIDGCGKSTQIDLLVSHLHAQNMTLKFWVRPVQLLYLGYQVYC